VLLGSTHFSIACLNALRELGVDVSGVVTTPAEIRISYSTSPVSVVQHANLADAAAAARCPVVHLIGKMSEYVEAVRALHPEFLLAAGWYHRVPRSIRELAHRGAAGIHASLLPQYRGGAPINWAIIRGEQRTGVTLFYLDDTIDGGDIIGQAEIPIGFEDTCATLYQRATQTACRLLERYIPLIEQGVAPRVPQDAERATAFPQRRPEDGAICWSWSARRLYDWVRAQTRPYPGAFGMLADQKVVIWRAVPLAEPAGAMPGTVLNAQRGAGVDVATGEGVLRLLEFDGCRDEDLVRGARFSGAS
jgi:methionyl-tRNA formyltransferase